MLSGISRDTMKSNKTWIHVTRLCEMERSQDARKTHFQKYGHVIGYFIKLSRAT